MQFRGSGLVFLAVLGLAGCGESSSGAQAGAGGSSGGQPIGSSGGSNSTAGSGGAAAGGNANGGSAAGGSQSGGSGAAGGSAGQPGAECEERTSFADGLSPERELYVATGGDDDAAGTEDAPFATLSKAVSEATPGTAIRILPGTYPGNISIQNLSGNVDSPIWIGGVEGQARPVFSGGSQGLYLSRVRFLVVQNIEVTEATANGINIDDGGQYANADATRFVMFRNIKVSKIGSGGNQDCLKMSGVNDFWVVGSQFEECSAGGSGVDMVGCHRGFIAQNTFTNMGSNAIQAKGGTADIEIHRNRMHHAGQRAINMGGSTSFEYFRPPLSESQPNFEAKNIRVTTNVISGAEAALAFVGCVDCVAAQNTIVDPGNWIIRILQETTSTGSYTFEPAKNGRFVNNIVYFNRGELSTYINVGANTDAPSFRFENNLWYAHDNAAQSTPTNFPSAETGGLYAQDPLLSGADHQTGASSPAIGAGASPAVAAQDYLGKCWKSPPSIGAYEAD